MIRITDLETPALLVEMDTMRANIARAADYAARHAISLRPHIKTHKAPAVAREQIAHGAAGLTCATPFEAEIMTEVTSDILVMYPPVGAHRAGRLAALAADCQLTVSLDSADAARAFSQALSISGAKARVMVELDAGMHRVGIAAVEDAVELARIVDSLPGVELAGFAFYPGHIRAHVSDQAAALAALTDLVSSARSAFAAAGLPVSVVSAGSTPTMWETHRIGGVTEMRPGTYVYNDRTTVEIGACAPEDCALTVLATVVSTAVPGQAVIDAGTKSLGREPIRGSDAGGFGSVQERPEVIVKSMSEEHGILDLGATDWRPHVGEQVRIVPNHVCIVVHLADVVYGAQGEEIVSSWPVAARGRGQPVLSHLGR